MASRPGLGHDGHVHAKLSVEELESRVATLEVEAYRLRRLFDHLPALVAFWDKDLKNVIANQAYVDWFGLSPDQIRGTHIRTVLGEDVYAKNLPFIRAALEGKEQLFSRTLVDPQGRERHSQASYVPEVRDGEVAGFFVLVTDVTPRVEAQRELDDAQELAKVGSWVFHPETNEMTWSREMFRIVGRDPETDRPLVDTYLAVVHPDDLPTVQQRLATITDVSTSYELRYRLLLPDGQVKHVHSRGRPEVDARGALTRLTGTLQDETLLQRVAGELASTNERLEVVNGLLTDTIAMLSHDIRQPIQGVTGFLDLLVADWDSGPPERLREYVDRAAAAAHRMNTLVDDVLMAVTIDSDALAVRPRPVPLAGLLRQVVDQQVPGVEIELEVRGDAVVLADPFHLRQVIANLIANAARYGRPPLMVSVDSDPTEARIRVVDHGEGVPADFVPHLFDRFTRATTGVAATQQGSGFGLYIVQQLIKANDGKVDYQPAEPSGACFTVTLPVVGRTEPNPPGG